MATARTPQSDQYLRTALNQFLVLLCLTGFTITEPVLTIFGANPSLFYFHNVESPGLVVAYAVAVAVLPALGMLAITLLVSTFSRRVGVILHYAFVGLLGGLWTIQLWKWGLGMHEPSATIGLAILGGCLLLLGYAKWSPLNTLLQIAAIAPLVTVALFLFSSETSGVMRTIEVAPAQVAPDSAGTSVLFIMLDEFPTMTLFDKNENIDSLRFPNLYQFSQQATWYRHYSVFADKTALSVPSILSGSLPQPAIPNMEHFPDNLFSLLAPSHHLTVYEVSTNLCELPQCSEGAPGAAIQQPHPDMEALLLQSASLWLRRISLTETGGKKRDDFAEKLAVKRPASAEDRAAKIAQRFNPANQVALAMERPKRLNDFIATITASDIPTLYFLHLEMPHTPWRFYPSGKLYDEPFTRPSSSDNNFHAEQWLAALSEYRFLMQAMYTDRLVGSIFSRMKSLDIWDETLIIVTADHGFSFKINTDQRIMQPETFDTLAYAPLIIKLPMQKEGRIDDSNIMAFDILPTIADQLNLTIPWKFEGLPADDVGIADRQDQKMAFLRKSKKLFSRQITGPHFFNDTEHFPDYDERKIGELQTDTDPLLLLNSRLKLARYLNQSVDGFDIKTGGSATVDELALLESPPTDRTPLGIVIGNVESKTTAQSVLIAVNGRFVTASPLITYHNVANTFIAMLPDFALEQKKKIGVYLVAEDALTQLTIH